MNVCTNIAHVKVNPRLSPCARCGCESLDGAVHSAPHAHNIGVVETIADRVAVMRAGLIEEQGEVDRVLGAPATDYTRSLLAAVPRLVTQTNAD